MAYRSDPRFQVLHTVRIRGRVATERFGDVADAEQLLLSLSQDGLLVQRDGRAAGWSLTPAGRAAHVELLAADRSGAVVDDAVRAAFERFVVVNAELIEVCTRWQVRPDGSLNDHSDAAFDAAVIGELEAIDVRIQPVCAELAGALQRFDAYGSRLNDALGRVHSGATEWFTSPAVDSYHSVWFELHEDLLQTLGIERTA